MVILHSRKLIFIHIAKNAGMYVNKVLLSIAKNGDFFLPGPTATYIDAPLQSYACNFYRAIKMRTGGRVPRKHEFASGIRDYFPDEFSEYRKFAVTRSPYDRAFSMYGYAFSTTLTPANRDLQAAFLKVRSFSSFDDFCLSGILFDLRRLNYFAPQSDYLTSDTGEILVDHLVPIETLVSDIEKVLQMNLPINPEKVNASPSQSFDRNISESALKTIQEIYFKDFKILGIPI